MTTIRLSRPLLSWAAATLCAAALTGPATAATPGAPGAGTPAREPARTAPAYKVASELQAAIDAKVAPQQPWVRDSNGQRWVRVLVTGQRTQADLAEARKDLHARGGTLLGHDRATASLTALLPASQVRAFAARPEVLHVAPLRDDSPALAANRQALEQHAARLAEAGLGPNSLRARSDAALLGED